MNNFSSIFSQSHCLSKKQLVDYIQQRLEKSEVYLVESHLNDCQMCNETLDTLLNEDLNLVEEDLKSIKNELTQKIFPPILVESNTETVFNYEKSQVKERVGDFEISRKTFYRILAAASVFLVFSFGAYSFYKHFIAPSSKEISMNTEQTKTMHDKSEGAYTTSPQNETIQLKTDEDIFNKINEDKKGNTKLPSNIKLKKEQNEADVYERSEYTKSNPYDKTTTFDSPNNDEPAVSNNMNAGAPPAPVAAKKLESKPENTFSKNDADNIQLKDNSPSNEAASEQESPKPNVNKILNKKSLPNNVKTEEISNFEMGLQFLNKQDYKKSIVYFEKALNTAKGNEREDIIYNLAIAYEKNGDLTKALNYYMKLENSIRYRAEAKEKINKLK